MKKELSIDRNKGTEQMIKRGATEGRNRIGGRPCAGCGRPIKSGLYCYQCLEKFRERAKTQGKRIEEIKNNDLMKVAVNLRETNILIAISDERNLNITKIILERGFSKYKIIATNNPLTAINTLTTRVVNLIVLDADYNGLDMLRRIRRDSRFREIPVLIMSGSTRRELVAEIFSLGIQDYIAKPCEPKDIIERVDKILNKGESESSTKTATTTTQTATRFNVLLIDDDIFDLRQEREAIKSKFPCELTTAQSAVEGMKILENKDIDLILVNLDMPFINGIKFLSLLSNNEQKKNIPVIIMTDTRDSAIINEIEKSSAAGYIRKPIENNEDLALIAEKLRKKR